MSDIPAAPPLTTSPLPAPPGPPLLSGSPLMPPADAGRDATQSRKTWVVDLGHKAQQGHFNPQTSRPHHTCIVDPGAQLWRQVEIVQRSTEGSGGVIFVQTPQGVIVVKSNSTLGQELFANKLAAHTKIASLGLPVPRMRVCGYADDSEWGELKKNVIAKSGKAVEAALDRPVLGVMELARGKPLDAVAVDEAEMWFKPQLARKLGALVIYDVVLNNSDRLPFANLWANEGNPGNVLFFVENGEAALSSIDNRTMTISSSSPTIAEAHFGRLHAALEDLKLRKADSAAVDGVNKFLLSLLHGFKPTQLFSEALYDGMRETIAAASTLTLEDLEELRDEVASAVKVDWHHVWADMVKLISLPQLVATVKAFRTFCDDGIPV